MVVIVSAARSPLCCLFLSYPTQHPSSRGPPKPSHPLPQLGLDSRTAAHVKAGVLAGNLRADRQLLKIAELDVLFQVGQRGALGRARGGLAAARNR